jgi:hypothetical protein
MYKTTKIVVSKANLSLNAQAAEAPSRDMEYPGCSEEHELAGIAIKCGSLPELLDWCVENNIDNLNLLDMAVIQAKRNAAEARIL